MIGLVSCRDVFIAIGEGDTSLPGGASSWAKQVETSVGFLVGGRKTSASLVRQGVETYLNVSGIESGYGFFAPHVPNGYKMVLELHYNDGRVEYEEPHGDAIGTGIRMTSLMDVIGRSQSDEVRAGIIRLLVHSVWSQHEGLENIHVLFGTVRFPSLRDYESGAKYSFQVLNTYTVDAEATPR